MTLVVFVILCKICVRFLLLASSGGFLLPGAQRGFFTAERGGRRQFGSGRDLPAGPFSTPRFLAAQRSAVSSRREEVAFVALAAQHNTRVCGPLCDPRGSRHEVSNHWGKLLRFLPALSFWIAIATRFAAHSTIKLPSSKSGSLSPPQGIFALQKSLRGDCGGDGVPAAVGNSSPRAKKFPEEICFAPRRVFQICRAPDD